MLLTLPLKATWKLASLLLLRWLLLLLRWLLLWWLLLLQHVVFAAVERH